MKLNVIYNQDCLEGIKTIPDESIDAVITDPPFFLGVTHNGQKGEYSDLAVMKPFFGTLFFEINRVLKKTGKAYVCTDWRTYPFLYPVISEYLPVRNLLVWDKKSGPGNYYSSTHEFVIFCSKGYCIMRGTNILTVKAFTSGAKKKQRRKSASHSKAGRTV
jgi:site-specific DNA-methyltransferase (adenine-specific)